MNKTDGFTIIELMITLAIAGILASIAMPSFKTMLQNNRQTTQINSLIGNLNIARSESIKRGLNVVLCRSSNGTTCASANGWEQGWLTFVDTDGDDTLDAGEEIIRVHGALGGGTTLTPNNNFINRIVYQPNGFTTQPGALALCDDRDGDGDVLDGDDFDNGHALIISWTGRVRSDYAENSTFTDCSGS